MKMKSKFVIGDTVCKKSGKPFKNGSNHQTIVEFGINEQDPNKRLCAIFSDGSVCNLDMLKHICFFDIETRALGVDIITRMIDFLKNEGLETPRHTVEGFDMEFIKKSFTREEKIGDTVFPVTYYSDGMVIVDYPTKL